MKLLLFNDYRLGVLKPGGRVVDVTRAVPNAEALPKTPLGAEAVIESVIDEFEELRPQFEQIVAGEVGVPFAEVKLRPPLPRPPNTLCAWGNFQDLQHSRSRPSAYNMDFFQKAATSIIASGDTVELPDLEEVTCYQPEPEFAYVIGRRARNVPAAQGLDYVFGYMNFSDISARGIPNRKSLFISKSQETWAPMGPVIVTKDEVPDPQHVQVRLWINGELKQDYNTDIMLTPIAAQVGWLSRQITLQPGDVVSCGVCHIGLSLINDGDVCEVEGEGLERLRFNVKAYGPRKTDNWAPPDVRRA